LGCVVDQDLACPNDGLSALSAGGQALLEHQQIQPCFFGHDQ
jgi:hypothetical protein